MTNPSLYFKFTSQRTCSFIFTEQHNRAWDKIASSNPLPYPPSWAPLYVSFPVECFLAYKPPTSGALLRSFPLSAGTHAPSPAKPREKFHLSAIRLRRHGSFLTSSNTSFVAIFFSQTGVRERKKSWRKIGVVVSVVCKGHASV